MFAAGHDCVHVRDLGLSAASEEHVMEAANLGGRVLISADTDFGDLLAASNAAGPSVLLLRNHQGRRADEIAALLLANLVGFEDDLLAAAIVVIEDRRVRIRRLPLIPV